MADNKFSRSQSLMASCVPMTKLQSILGGKWKILIVWYISVYKVQRFGELQRRIGNEITKSTLTKQLRELENDGWINRQIYQEIPPRVEYTLTELSESFIPIFGKAKYKKNNWINNGVFRESSVYVFTISFATGIFQ